MLENRWSDAHLAAKRPRNKKAYRILTKANINCLKYENHDMLYSKLFFVIRQYQV